ncbi:MAG: hypothetical protein HPY67_11755 [Syntrophaceae bacterium]|nr:hypothetical protein [Syntrophaceae bacterium]
MQQRKFLVVLLMVSIPLFAGFSATSKPNVSVIDPGYDPDPKSANEYFVKAKGILGELGRVNPVLATELGRLPEIRACDAAVIETLQRIARLQAEKPEEFQKALEQMLTVGLPEYRRYNTPLQAYFWLVEDGKMKSAKRILDEYDLLDLLRSAWVRDDTVGQSGNPAVAEKHRKRWGDFDTVIDRLNAPELVDFYEKRYFKYGFNRSKDESDSYSIFMRKGGNCVDYANFTYRCLSWAGYHSWKEKVPGHLTVILKAPDGKYYALDNARRINRKPIGLAGPFDEVRELMLKLGYY